MGRIRLDWDIESQKISKRDGEDPAAKRARRRSILKLLLLIGIVIGMIIAAPLLVRQRLLDVQNQVERLLRDTVHAEVAALRIGDLAAFLDIQRSATDEWPNAQRTAFQEYAAMKAEQDLKLTGTILAIAIDGQRGRVLVEEIVNGAPYAKPWFYWRYADGWRHVPPDYTFWGETRRIESDALRIQYRAVDELFAQQLSQTITAWLDHGCGILNCESLPPMTIDIAADAPPAMSWADESQRRLLMRSPYVHGARADQPFDPPRQLEAAELLAERLMQAQTGGLPAAWPHDVFHLRQSVRLYLVEQFAQIDTGAPLIKSLASQYGIDKISQLVSLFAPTADMSIIQQVIPDPIGQAKLDWRGFIAWRLNAEDQLIASRAENEWLTLYDLSQESVRAAAYERYRASLPPPPRQVTAQQMQTAADGTPQLRMTVRTGSGSAFRDHIILFSLVNTVWKRAS